MMTPPIASDSLRHLDLPLPGGRILRVALHGHGETADLVLVVCFEGEALLKSLAGGVNMPASTLPELSAALLLIGSER